MIDLTITLERARKLESEMRLKFGEFNHYTLGVRDLRVALEQMKEERDNAGKRV